MKNKSETRQFIKCFHAHVLTQFGILIKTFRSDNGAEFNMNDFFSENGIIHQRSCVNTPQQNAVVERKHQHILNVARALRFQAHLPVDFWGHCVMHAVYIINRLPSPVIECSSPYQRLYGEVPDISNLKVFGCLCYAATLSGNKHKMAPRGRKCLFIGILAGMKGYMLYDLGDGSIFVSRDVTFYEEEFPMAADISQSQSQQGPPLPNIPTHHELELYEQQQPPNQPRHVEQTSTEQQGSVHEQPHGNITPSTDLVESQQVQNSEPTSTSQPDVTDQEGIDDSRQPTRDDQAKGMQMDQCQATDKLQTESMMSLAFTQLQIVINLSL
nr:Retrovirus-related Pol polyprotein from transposon TNT 1-94 [Ipomoea batatas]